MVSEQQHAPYFVAIGEQHGKKVTDLLKTRASEMAAQPYMTFLRWIHSDQGLPIPPNDQGVFRSATSSLSISASITTVLNSQVVIGWETAPDNTKGWVTEVSLATIGKDANLFALQGADRLKKLPKGRPAEHSSIKLSSETIANARYAGQVVVTETDAIDGMTTGGVMSAFRQMGINARRTVADLVFSLLLRNPTLAGDSVALFNASHSNYGTGGGSAFSATSLEAAMAAIGNQVYTDPLGDALHINSNPRYLLVPPDLYGAARIAVRNMVLGDGRDLEVRSESRLGTHGVVDPSDETVYTGTATNWLLCAEANERPSIAISGLNGKLEPSIRSFVSDQGEWGQGLDVVLDCGAAALDYRGMYFSAGA